MTQVSYYTSSTIWFPAEKELCLHLDQLPGNTPLPRALPNRTAPLSPQPKYIFPLPSRKPASRITADKRRVYSTQQSVYKIFIVNSHNIEFSTFMYLHPSADTT